MCHSLCVKALNAMLRPLLWKRLKPNSANRAIQQPPIRPFHLDPNICTGQHTARSRWRSHFKRCNKTVKLWWGPVKITRVLQLSPFHHHKEHCRVFFFHSPRAHQFSLIDHACCCYCSIQIRSEERIELCINIPERLLLICANTHTLNVKILFL